MEMIASVKDWHCIAMQSTLLMQVILSHTKMVTTIGKDFRIPQHIDSTLT